MGDFGSDTAITPIGGGCYRAHVSRDWEIWGPMGGYVAAIAMRAAGAEATHHRPASFFCHFLSATRFGEIELRVEALRRGRAVEFLRVHVTQGEREVLDATVCIVADNEGLEHEVTNPPLVAHPDELRELTDLLGRAARWQSGFVVQNAPVPGSSCTKNPTCLPAELLRARVHQAMGVLARTELACRSTRGRARRDEVRAVAVMAGTVGGRCAAPASRRTRRRVDDG